MKPKNELNLEGVNTDINERWKTGEEHHPESIELMAHIADLDYKFQNDYFCWKFGGDGDNGEQLMYLLDIYFDAKDNEFWDEHSSPKMNYKNTSAVCPKCGKKENDPRANDCLNMFHSIRKK